LTGAQFADVARRGKYLLFQMRKSKGGASFTLLGHLGMTGRMYLLPNSAPLPQHAAVVLDLGRAKFVYEDTRYFGRLTLDLSALARLGPEPLSDCFSPAALARALRGSRQAIKIKLLDQSVVAGVGNIYASEALFRAGISPRQRAGRLTAAQIRRLWRAVRSVLAEAIEGGSTVPLNFGGGPQQDGLFYFGRAAGAPDYYTERLQVYDREGQPCLRCGALIMRLVQASRSTYCCPGCQGRKR
jgi:formamidopyrimidine-DNA glycosylase